MQLFLRARAYGEFSHQFGDWDYRFSFPERDGIRLHHHRTLDLCLSMISAQTRRVCPEGKPLHTFPDHALGDFETFAEEEAMQVEVGR